MRVAPRPLFSRHSRSTASGSKPARRSHREVLCSSFSEGSGGPASRALANAAARTDRFWEVRPTRALRGTQPLPRCRSARCGACRPPGCGCWRLRPWRPSPGCRGLQRCSPNPLSPCASPSGISHVHVRQRFCIGQEIGDEDNHAPRAQSLGPQPPRMCSSVLSMNSAAPACETAAGEIGGRSCFLLRGIGLILVDNASFAARAGRGALQYRRPSSRAFVARYVRSRTIKRKSYYKLRGLDTLGIADGSQCRNGALAGFL
jgi:hypothetical protein